MNYSTDNTRIIDRQKVPAPYELVNKHPINDDISKLVYGTRQEISQILHDKDDRLLVVVGPCSIHDPESAIEYGKKLIEQNIKFKEELLIVMRVYFEKPRTTVGWKGLINDPDLNESFKIYLQVQSFLTLFLPNILLILFLGELLALEQLKVRYIENWHQDFLALLV